MWSESTMISGTRPEAIALMAHRCQNIVRRGSRSPMVGSPSRDGAHFALSLYHFFVCC